ncbi:MAG: hypothetical protein ACYDHX_13035 [Methanothrix sp.]
MDLFLEATEPSEVTTEIIRHQYLDMLRRCSFHTANRITNRAMRILRAKRYSFAPAMLKPERKSPSIPTVEIVSPLKICAVHKEIIFDLLMRALDGKLPYVLRRSITITSNWNEKKVF